MGVKLRALFFKYKEIILYVFFGGLTTLVNWGLYFVLADMMGAPYLWATAAAQIAAILFAYITNRIWVFKSKVRGFSGIMMEMLRFFGCRAVSFFMELGCMYVGVDLLHIDDVLMKLLSNVIVVIVNYIFSKVFIFREPAKGTEK